MLWDLSKEILFKLDAEKVHHTVLTSLKCLSGSLNYVYKPIENFKTVLGMKFLNPVGLAAGFDKNAEVITALPCLGFGFAEVGTVTLLPQNGNPRPRLFRSVNNLSLFNRMGFNSDGADVVFRNLSLAKENLPSFFRVGVNIGKNKTTNQEDAAQDYKKLAQIFKNVADYIVLNVSSPNTPGLRDLQTVENLKKIVSEAALGLGERVDKVPLLIKLAPEMTQDALFDVLKLNILDGVHGWVLTNTLAGTWSDGLSGGYSGGCLTEISRKVLMNSRAQTSLPIVSVGGILDQNEAKKRFELGADLIQIYSGWVYNGPLFPRKLATF